MLHDGRGWSYLQHGLLLAVYVEVVKGHTVTYVHCKRCENCDLAARNRSLNGTTYMLYMLEVLERACRFNFTCLGTPECQRDKFREPGRRSGAFRLTLSTAYCVAARWVVDETRPGRSVLLYKMYRPMQPLEWKR